MEEAEKGRNGMRDRRGSTMLYAVVLILFLMMISAGYLTAAAGRRKQLKQVVEYRKAHLEAMLIHRSFCEAAAGGNSELINQIQADFNEEYEELCEEYDEVPEAGEEHPETEYEEDEELRFERFLEEHLTRKSYLVRGVGEDEEEDLRAEITAEVFPLESRAQIHSRITKEKYTFLFDANLTLDGSGICSYGGEEP